jgi:hypothetical protein
VRAVRGRGDGDGCTAQAAVARRRKGADSIAVRLNRSAAHRDRFTGIGARVLGTHPRIGSVCTIPER